MQIQVRSLLGLFFLAVLASSASIQAESPAVDKVESKSDFYAALADHYRLPDSVVRSIHERRLPDDELAVIFFLAAQAAIQPDDVADLRLLKKSWMELTTHFGLTAEIFYVPVTSDPSPPFAKPYALYKAQPRTLWKRITLEDPDILNLVNLRFVSSYFKVPPEDVIRLRAQNKSYVTIVKEISSPEYKARMTVTEKQSRPHLREPKKKSQ